MKKVLCGVWLLFAATEASWADEKLVRAAASSVAQFAAIGHYCPMQIPTNASLADWYTGEFAKIGRANATPAEWSRVLDREAKRMLLEIKATGDRPWCENQRRFMEEAGVVGLLPR